jgi:hypothetical protein
MADMVQPVSQILAGSKLGAIAPYIRDEQYTLRDLGALRGRSLAWSVLGAVIGVIALVGVFFTYFSDMETASASALIFLVPCVVLYLIVLNAFVRMRSVAGYFPELAAYDARKPILYLRNFAAENPDVAHESGLPIATKVSFEHFIGTFFWKHGRVLALGDPLRRRPSGSVSRLFVTDAGWRETVTSTMEQAQAIIIHYGAGANVDWEVDQTARFAETPRLVIMNVTREPQQKRVSDLVVPAALRGTFEGSKARLPSGPDLMLGVVRGRKGEMILMGPPDSQALAKFLNKLKSALGKSASESLPPDVKAIRDRVHFWSYLPMLICLPGLAALVLMWGAAMLAPGLWG